MKYLRVRNWSKFQHYKDRNPPWIKLHFELLSSHDWVMFDDASKLLAVACMMVASRDEGHIPDNPEYIKRVAYISQADFKPLIDSGFLEEVTERKPMLASARPETEPETETYRNKPEPERVNGFSHANGFGSFQPTLETADQLLGVAPGWDQHKLTEIYNSWTQGKDRPNNPQAAFLGWAKKFTKGQRPK